MQGAAYEAVVLHRELVTTQQMQQDRLAQRVKNADVLFGILHRYEQIKIIKLISRRMLITS